MNPRRRLFEDLEKEISAARDKKFRVVLMMDANEDWTKKDGKELKAFMDKVQLRDPLYERHYGEEVTATYARGTKRLDYILMDAALLGSVRRIGTLGLHEAMLSDHVMVYVDFDEREAFDGHLNRPVRIPSREFILAQSDKCEKFMKVFLEQAELHNYGTRIERLCEKFKQGVTEALIREYNNLDQQIQNSILHAAKKTIKKKFGYNRSPRLGKAGYGVNFWKSVLSAKTMNIPVPEKTKRMAEELLLDMEYVDALSKPQTRQRTREAVEELREVQERADEERVQWTEENYQDIARARGELDWKSNMEKMLRETKQRAIEKKLTVLTKGSRRSLDWIEIPIGQWFYSHTNKEIYKYDRGVFECYAAKSPSPSLIPDAPWRFYKHHHLKVPHDDMVLALLVREEEDQLVLEAVYRPSMIWRTVNDTREIEMVLLERNSRHLKQAEIEEGRCHDETIQRMRENHGTDLMDEVLNGTIEIPEATDEIIVAWIQAHKQGERVGSSLE
eukprot:scaffold25072_cov68-Cyclotella_meneghiniana.AAC.2